MAALASKAYEKFGLLFNVNKRGVEFEVWDNWKKTPCKQGTLAVTVGGLAWRPQNGKRYQRRSGDKVAELFEAINRGLTKNGGRR